jgi:hypothetical protein
MSSYQCAACYEPIEDGKMAQMPHEGALLFWHGVCAPPNPKPRKRQWIPDDEENRLPSCDADVWENRLALISELEARGIAFRLAEDGSAFDCRLNDYRGSDAARADDLFGIQLCKEGIRLGLLWRAGLCLTCGVAPIVRGIRLCLGCMTLAGRANYDRIVAENDAARSRRQRANTDTALLDPPDEKKMEAMVLHWDIFEE